MSSLSTTKSVVEEVDLDAKRAATMSFEERRELENQQFTFAISLYSMPAHPKWLAAITAKSSVF
jgi:hypothetical protein